MNRNRWRPWCLALALLPTALRAQDFGFQPPPDANDRTAPSIMRDLAERIIPVYQDADTDAYLSNLAALQLVTANYEAAYDTAQTLRDRHPDGDAGRTVDRAILYEIYAHARAIEAAEKIPFAQAFERSFHDVVPKLDGRDAAVVMARLAQPLPEYGTAVQAAFDRWRKAEAIPQPEALDLVRKYLVFEARRSFAPLVPALVAAEDRRRYIALPDPSIKTAGGVIHAVIVRPNSDRPLPTLLRFTLDPDENDARLTAAHGYVGVVAFARGRRSDGHGATWPFRHEGDEARAVINWIARQPWSDGRVGLYGEGYSGYAAWAAARRPPVALKAIATAAPMVPGLDFPMAGQIFDNAALRWLHDHTAARPAPVYPNEDQKWQALDQIWYRGGGRYGDIDRLFFGRPSPLFRTWLMHPSYDAFWRRLIPQGREYPHLGMPVLTVAGSYGAAAGALYYYSQHMQFDPKADHTLLVGPWDEDSIRNGAGSMLRNLPLDGAAVVDLRELRYQWFDQVLKKASRPALLSDRVNVQLAGSNDWRHAPSLSALAGTPQRYWLDPATKPDAARLLAQPSASTGYVEQRVDLADRSDAHWREPSALVFKPLPLRNAIAFSSDPLPQATDLVGTIAGRLDFVPNRQDVDLDLALYEQQRNGDFVQLFTPYEFRASYAGDRRERRLLRAGERQQLDFRVERIVGRRLAAGSRLVLVLGISKRPDRQIDYGSGKAVNQETLADAGPPLRVRWYGGSYVELPLRK